MRRAILFTTAFSMAVCLLGGGKSSGEETSDHDPLKRAVPGHVSPVPAVPSGPASLAAPSAVKTVSGEKREAPVPEPPTIPAKAAAEEAGAGELSAIEKAARMEGGADEDKSRPAPYRINNLAQFGYNFFRSPGSGFAPVTDVPVGPEYVIGPGDRIILNLWGSVEGTHELEVNRSGEIVLPRIGSIKVWGTTFGNLPELFRRAIGRVYRDFDLNVTMGKLRVIKVFVVGEVKAPGDYNLTPLSTLLNALGASGGPLKTGTLRNIQIKRGGAVVETVDLYDFFLKGDKSRDIRLQSGDTIFVPVIGRVAGIAGNVKRPAIYELKAEKNLDELIALAEGFLPTGYLQRVQISRVMAHEKNVVADFNIDPKAGGESLEQITRSIAVQDMDIVKIFPIDATLRGHVRLDGYVLRPGNYALQPGMRLSRLLLPDNLLPEYYRNAAEITRLNPPDYHPEIFFVDLGKAVTGDQVHDLELKEFDKVRVFSRWEMEEMPKVRVSGEVQRPGEYRLFEKMTVRDLIMEAGNLKLTAFAKNAEISRIVRTDGKAKSFAIVINVEEAMKGNPKDNLVLSPFDELTVRKIPNWANEKERHITLRGEVQFPGVYPIYKGERLSSVIGRAGGFTEKAYLRGGKFTRQSIKEMQQKRMGEMLAKAEQEVFKKQAELASVAASKDELDATRTALDGLRKNIEVLKAAEAEGRLVIHLERTNFAGGVYDIEVQGGDVLDIPETPSSINVLGQVYNPTSVVPVADQDVAYYLTKSGGPTQDADYGSIYVVKVDGTVLSSQQSPWYRGLFFSGFTSTTLEPGDTVIVPQRLEKVAWMRDIKDIATILGQLALTAGVMVAAGL